MFALKSKGDIVGNMILMIAYVVLDGNLFDVLPFDNNLFVKDVKMMFLQVSLDVSEKGILVSAKEMKHEIFINVYTGLMKETHVHMLLGIQATRIYIPN